ncbi:MAG: EAL domain-containing protein [Aquificae bacterium]|nr:EAL domain-containing protein [Aquificota bacterium]
MGFEGLDLLPFPVVIVGQDFRLVFANEEARKLGKGERCYELLFGFSRPCHEVPGYRCPLLEIKSGKTERGITVNEYPLGGKFRKLLLETFRTKEGLFAEIVLDYETVQRYRPERSPFYLDKAELIDFIQELLDRNRSFFVSTINVKKLKSINQFFGLEVGDAVIHAIEKILHEFASKYRFYYASVAGGYFIVVNPAEGGKPYRIEREIFEAINNLQSIFNLPVKPRISIISTEVSPLITKSAEDVLKIMFYAEKFKKDEGVLFLDVDKLNEILTTLGLKRQIIRSLESILKHREVDVFFQPVVSLKTGEVTALETLIRIKQNGEYIAVGRYIDLIYELNLITEFDLQVLEKLKEYLPELKRLGKKVFINVSATDLKREDYRKKLVETLTLFKEEGLELGVELTEQVVLEEYEFLEFLHSSLGLKFSIDDFGTGFSSLKLVIDLTSKGIINAIKLDCELVKQYFESEQARALINSVVGFARTFGIETIAECVEDAQQAETLKKVGVTSAQGWYFFKPAPLSELLKKL